MGNPAQVDMWRARYTRGHEGSHGHGGLTVELFESRQKMEPAVLRLLIEAEASMRNRPPSGRTRRWHTIRQWFKATDDDHRDRGQVYGCIRFHGLDRLEDGEWVEHPVDLIEPKIIVSSPAALTRR